MWTHWRKSRRTQIVEGFQLYSLKIENSSSQIDDIVKRASLSGRRHTFRSTGIIFQMFSIRLQNPVHTETLVKEGVGGGAKNSLEGQIEQFKRTGNWGKI